MWDAFTIIHKHVQGIENLRFPLHMSLVELEEGELSLFLVLIL